jgi:ribose 5-phosphate isomerase B
VKIAIGSDHAGYEFKEKIKSILNQLNHETIDFGTNSKDSVDYPDYGLQVAHAVAEGKADYGITICWTGNGMAIAANKVKGIRAGLALSVDMAYLTRSHNDANVLSISQKWTPEDVLEEIIQTFLNTKFEGGRHIPRVEKIQQAEC